MSQPGSQTLKNQGTQAPGTRRSCGSLGWLTSAGRTRREILAGPHPRSLTEKESPMLRLRNLIAVCLVSTLLAACAGSSGGLSTRDDDKRYLNVSLGGVNHTGQYLYSFSVNGYFGGNVNKYAGGSAGICCVRIPRIWRPGLTVDIQYDLLINDGKDDNWKTKKGVPVEPYTEPGSVYVHFFPNDEIRVVVSNPGPRSTLHPIPYPTRPSDPTGDKRQ